MSNLSKLYCHGYMVTPVIEACQQRGLFKLLDVSAFRERAWLINELKANEGYFTIALEALESLGWLEKTADAYRLANMAGGYPELGLTSLYAIEPEQLITQEAHVHRLREKIERVFFRSEAESSASLDPARGAILVPLVLSLRKVDVEKFCDELNRLFPLLSQTIIELFARQQWLMVDNGRLTASGKALLQDSVFNVATSCRPVLQRINDLLFGNPGLVFSEGRKETRFIMSNPFGRQDISLATVFEDLRQEIEEPAGDINQLDKLRRHHLTAVDVAQPINTALGVLAGDQPVNYLDQQGRLVDAVRVLSCWQQHFRVLAQQLHDSRLLILEAHAAPCPPVGQQRENFEFLEFDWIDRLAHGYLISAEAFITVAASVGLFNNDCVRRYPRTSAPCRMSLHSLIKRDYIIRHASETDLERLCQLEKLCWQHTRTSRKQIRSRLQLYPRGQFVLEKESKVLGVIYSQRIANTDRLMTCNAEEVHKLHQESGPIIQLLAVNIDPQTQNAGYGDQLLEFMLQRCSLMTGIEHVVGVTLCKNYNSAIGQSFEQYIQQLGSSQDPVLAFHQAHGAEVVKAIPGYRPQDHANMSSGVLVAYDILNRTPGGSRPAMAENIAITAETGVVKADEQQIRQFVVGEAAKLLGISSGELDIDRPVMEMGLDSADLLKLGRQVEDKFGLKLGVGFFFEHSNIRKVIGYLTTMLVAAPEASTNPVSQIAATQLPDESALPACSNRSDKNRVSAADIAIIGMACKLPGGIETPVQLWRALAAGKSMISSFPTTRRPWPARGDKPGIDQGGFVKDADAFDAPFFRMSRTEAEITDPQQRILLELAWACLEDACILPDALKGSNTGVYIGASNCDYSRLIQETELEVEAHHGTGSSLAVLANRLSYFFDFSGPSLLIDTACSSSLVALHAAIQSLRSGECATALVGGVNFICHPDLSIAYHKAGMLAPDGRCKVFDAKADGYVRSEGAVMLLLKPLSAAVAERDQVHAVIKGSAVNHGGLAAGLTVPNPQKQSDLLIAAWQDARIAAHDLSYIEAHGTGTSLGDPIEIQGIKAAYMHLAAKEPGKPCSIGSVKSNLGHLESAAGITGLLKVVLSIQHRQLPASINCDRLNPMIQLRDTPFYIQDQLREWEAMGPRVAAVSSFGSGGANAHVVVQEYLRDARPRSRDHNHLFVLSAASHDRLRIYVMRVIGWLEQEPIAADLADAIYTWQISRAAMKHRLAIKVKDHLELLSKLKQWLAGDSDLTDVWSDQVVQETSNISRVWHTKSGQQLIDQAVSERDLEQLGALWASGIEIDWNTCYSGAWSGERKPQRVSLPTYPFARERYWINSGASKQSAVSGRSPALLHPLLHSNTSTLSEQRFSSQFSGNEFFLADHVIKGSKVLPGVCYLEIARAAVMASATENGRNDRVTVRLKNVVWVSPIIVDEPQCVHIGVYADEQGEIEYEIYSNVPGEAAEERSEVIHGQGRAGLSVRDDDAGDGWLDCLALRAGCDESIDAAHCYAAFSAMGIEYGPGHRGIRRLGVGRDAANKRYILAEVELPGCVSETQAHYVLHPSVLDSALQASMGFALADFPRSASGGSTGKPSLPFELEEIEILDRSPAHAYVYIRESTNKRRSEQPDPVKIQKFDIDICDENGRVSVRLKGLTSRVLERGLRMGSQSSATAQNNNESRIATLRLVPRWDAVTPARGTRWPPEGSRVLLVGGTNEQEQAIRARYPYVRAVKLSADNLIDNAVEQIHTQGALEHVVWLVPASEATDVTDERLIKEQSQGVLGGLRLIKALLRLGYEAKNLGWTVVTHQTQAIRCDEHIQPSHASVLGLIGSLAKEHPHWKIRLVDLPSMGEWPLDQLLVLPADGRGDVLAYRVGEWFRQELVPCDLPASNAMTCRQGGVYVVIGGAGGIGEVFSEHLIRNYQAQTIWIGRRELDAHIQAKLDRLSTLGPAPSYIRADATDRDALARAYQMIKAQHGQIHGLVHAAIALADKSLAQMDEGRFKASLAAKVDVSVRMAQVFEQEPMDYVLFFSSLLSFSKPAGQSNYLAGCTFEDAFAHQLSQVWSCPVKIMNWGYWGSRGIVASEAYRARMAQNGVGSIEPEEGMVALEQLLSAPILQLALSKAQPGVLAAAVSQDRIAIAQKQLPPFGDLLSTSTKRVLVEPAEQGPGNVKDMQRLMGQLLFDQLRGLGLFNEGQGSITAWKEQSRLPALYDRWLDESVLVLAREGYVTVANGLCTVSESRVADRATLWSEWDIRKDEWLKDADLNAQVRLLDATLRALPEILTGKRLATEVLFPKASMELVEGFYKGNPVADYFNAVLADAVVEFVELRRKHDPSARIRIVEIGAGTGGTSEGIFKRLKPYEACIAEYSYTDISKAFLMHAERAYGPTTPYLAYRLLNVEQALESQGVELGTYDLAVTTNVLHATKNIRRTLRNAKGLLKQNGVLLLNEMLGHSLFTHLTFGLLEGWWLYEDAAVRIPGTPTLAPETWQRVLEGEGFRSIFFPAFASHAQGQQIIVAQSDGVIRQSRNEQPAVYINTQVRKKEAATPRGAPQAGPPKQTTLAPAEDIHLHHVRDKAIAALKKIVSQTIKLPVHEIDSREELEKYGIDSILIVSMVDALRNVFVHISSTVFFEYRTIDALVDNFIATEEEAVRRWVGTEETGAWEASADPNARRPNSPSIAKPAGRRQRIRPVSSPSELRHNGAGLAETHAQDIAIIGLSGRYPEAVNIEAYWRNLREGKDCIIEVPRERWDWQKYFSEDRSQSGCHYSKWGGFIAGVDEFDPLFFNIPPSEAKYIDPQERLFLEHAWMAVEDAGYTRASLQAPYEHDLPGQVGVYVGVMYSEYQLFGAEARAQNLKMGFAGNLASIANRVSYVLNLHGPSMTLDTMCSSSLTAIHVACQDLKQGRTSMAIAGGVNVSVHPNKYLMLSVGQFISGDGHCQSFGEGGDGFIPAEGVGAIVLKRLSEAERDGDHIYGIIRGSAINHGGKTNGYTVPSPQAQTSAISRALAESRIDARHISYVEAHGTGTKLGDPIEIAALSKAFQHHTQDNGFCLIGSVKSNIGHCESAAGIAGLTKVLLQMQHQQIVPSLHSEQLNPHIDFARSPFGVNQELRQWEQPEIDGRKLLRIAGISSFGAGGSNAHMIVEEYQAAVQALAFANVIVPLSARTEEQLKQKGRDLLDYIRPRVKTTDLVSMAYTLQVGREAMEQRVGLLASTVEQLVEKLEAYVAGGEGIEDVYQGQVKGNKELLSLFNSDGDLQQTVEKWIEKGRVSQLLELWVKGLEVDWSKLYGEAKPQRMSLPTYPFAKERYWIERVGGGKQMDAAAVTAAVLHPLLHSNTSDLTEQSYSTRLSGEEYFLQDHQVNGQRVVPGGVYLEMARVAVQKAARSSQEVGWELRNVEWAQAMVVKENRQISIVLLAKDSDEVDFEIYSQEGEQEIVHCQGQAVWSRQAEPARLDIEQLKRQMGQGQLEAGSVYARCARMGLVYGPALQAIKELDRGNRQVLAQLRLPGTIESAWEDYVLHPSLMEGVLQSGVVLLDGLCEGSSAPRVPFALERLRIVARCSREMVVWARYAPGSQGEDKVAKLDIDLCDERGNVCAQMRGVSWQPVSWCVAEPVVEKAAPAAAAAARKKISMAPQVCREIVLVTNTAVKPVQVEPKKPKSIALAAPGKLSEAGGISSADRVRQPAAGRPPITLSTPAPGVTLRESAAAAAVSAVRLFDDGGGIFSIQIAAGDGSHMPARDRMAHLGQALERVQEEASIKVLKLGGLERCFQRGGREDYNEAVEQKLYQAIVSFPYPVIAVLAGDTVGASLLGAALCDLMVCNEDASYGYTDEQGHLYPTAAETELFSQRLGAVQAQELLYVARTATGKQLRAKGWTCSIVGGEQVEAYTQNLALTLARKSQNGLRLLKQHLTRDLAVLVKDLRQVEAAGPATEHPWEWVGEEITSPAEHIHLDTSVENVVVIKFGGMDKQVRVKELVGDLGRLFAKIHQNGVCKVVVLASADAEFVRVTESDVAEDVVLDFQRVLAESEIPVVAALEGNAKGHAWVLSQLCDACVYSRTGSYSAAEMRQSPVVEQTAVSIFIYRLGKAAGQEILLTGAEYSGEDLERRVGGLLVAEQDQVLAKAVEVAKFWARLPRATMAAWKKHTAASVQNLQKKMGSLSAAGAGWEEKEAAEGVAAVAMPVALRSKVVTATAYAEGIVVVKMEDRQAKNMFSEAFMEGMREAFAHIEQTPAYKVVVLTGYDSYFSSGGTKESLLAIQGGKAKFTDYKIFQLPLDCKLPVIAAMQGHGIGAGWSLGMFADIVLLSEESRYVSPYMNYGFTPGAGATWSLGDKLGQDLARESLLTGDQYAGSELKARGLRLAVLPRAEVNAAAMVLARQIAQRPRRGLMGLKQRLTGNVAQLLEETYRLELAMHEKTFVGQSDTLAQIHENFYEEIEATGSSAVSGSTASASVTSVPAASAPPAGVEAAVHPSVDSDVLSAVTASLKTLLTDELHLRESDIEEDVQFVDLGLDSISGVTWIRKINEKYHTTIEATKVYSYPTLTQLSRYVKEEAEKLGTLSRQRTPAAVEMPAASGDGVASQAKMAPNLGAQKLTSWRGRRVARFSSAPASRPIHSLEPIAVIGMSGRFPQSKNLDEFWQNIAQGKNCVTQVPPTRWDMNRYYQPGKIVAGKTNSQWAGFIEDYDRFDPLFFNISPTEAENMDPQQRLFLQGCWHSIENAGYDARVLSGSKCGVFVGCTTGDYATLSLQQRLSAQGFTGNAMSILAGRISYFLNLQGPCLSIDTACSSSLVAIAHACDSLISGGSDLALAGGVYVMAGPEMHVKMAQAGMLSSEGKCFTFDQRADGFVPGEGVGVVMLKRLADAQRDQDIIYGVIEGWGVNQDGKTNGITAPNPESQTRLEQGVYDKHQIDPAKIHLIEAHGTGTKLGDPIEVEGLKKAFRKYTQNKEYCALGSVKSNIGHCATAAGVAGFIKLILALKHKQLPPTINFEQLNEHIDLKDSPFCINNQLQEWKLNGADRRRGAISSFGFSGTNAHVVVGEYLALAEVKPPVTVITQNTKIVVPLSARNPEQLNQKACDLRDFICKEAPAADLIEIAYTLQVGREAMEERVGFLISSIEQLAEKLEAYLAGEQGIEDVYLGQVRRNKESISIISQDDDVKETIVDKWLATNKLSKLLDLWVRGLELDWNKLYGEVKPQRISLPTYPFARERYWIDTTADGVAADGVGAAVLHPLLHRNTSDLSEQRYSSTFTGDEFFLADHRVNANGHADQKVLPGAAYLEMVRAAIAQVSPIQPEASILELRNTVWLNPVVVTEPKQVSIVLFADDNDQVSYEIYSIENDQETIHCQGNAVFSRQPAPAKLDIEQLKGQMEQIELEASSVYAMLAKIGLNYGPAHQGIVAIYLGEKQVLAQLHMPAILETNQHEYVLHPSLVDSALQASIALIVDVNHVPSKPVVPFALDSLRIISACTKEMVAWVRHSRGSKAEDKIVKLDIDLCDQQGNVCVQIHGFVSRELEGGTKRAHEKALNNPAYDKSSTIEDVPSFDSAFYRKLIADVVNHEVSVDEAVELA